jgi:integrase/recombinase XerD
MHISEVTKLEESHIDRTRETLTIVHLKEFVKLKCPNCGAVLVKRQVFCPNCGNKIDQVTQEKVEKYRQRIISVDRDTLKLLDEYLKWRLKFPYRGPRVFPITRQRAWQLIGKIGRRAGIR